MSLATEHLENAVSIAPDFFEAHVALARQYRAGGRIEDAATHWIRAAGIRGHDAGPLVELGRLYMERGDAGAALAVLERAVNRDPKDPAATYYYAFVLYQDGQYHVAEVTLKQFLKRDSRVGAIELLLASVFTKQQKPDDALEQINAYLEQNPEGANRLMALELRKRLMAVMSANN